MAAKCLLFVYGLLKPGFSPPRSVSAQWQGRVRGRLYDLGAFPAALALGADGEPWLDGVVLELDADELPELDHFEDVESGEFRRLVVTTEQGDIAWAYEYGRAVPDDAPQITAWRSS